MDSDDGTVERARVPDAGTTFRSGKANTMGGDFSSGRRELTRRGTAEEWALDPIAAMQEDVVRVHASLRNWLDIRTADPPWHSGQMEPMAAPDQPPATRSGRSQSDCRRFLGASSLRRKLEHVARQVEARVAGCHDAPVRLTTDDNGQSNALGVAGALLHAGSHLERFVADRRSSCINQFRSCG